MWNTYVADELNSVLNPDELLSVGFMIYDIKEKFLLDKLLWRNVAAGAEYKNIARFGLHKKDGGYFDIDYRYAGLRLNSEFASDGENFVWRITPVSGDADSDDSRTPDERYRLLVTAAYKWNARGSLTVDSDCIQAGRHTVRVFGERDDDTPVNTPHSGFLMRLDKPVYIVCGFDCGSDEDIRRLDTFISGARRETVAELPRIGSMNAADNTHSSDDVIDDIPAIIQAAMEWNMIYEPIKRRVCAPVARSWCAQNGRSFGSYVLFEWDTFLSSLMCAVYDKDAAYRQVSAMFDEMGYGMIPNYGAQRGSSFDRSQPPLGSHCLLLLYEQFGERELLEKYYDRLCEWNEWWTTHRDGDGNGLFEWGSDPIDEGITPGDMNNKQAAMYESGLDNSPMYDSVAFNPDTHTLELDDVGLCALWAHDCDCIAKIAGILGYADDAAKYSERYESMKSRVNELMWDDVVGMYCNRHWNGELDHVFSPTNFYVLLARIASPERAERIVYEHLKNPDEFWGEYVIPSVSRAEKSFYDQDYWRGRVWGPMNYLVYAGLAEYGFDDVSREFAEKSLRLFMGEWQSESHIHENYNCITGDGDDRHNADAFYTWGALLAYIYLLETSRK